MSFQIPSSSKSTGAYYKLRDAVAKAIDDYDKTNDHLKHGHNSDCVRCNLQKVMYGLANSPSNPKY